MEAMYAGYVKAVLWAETLTKLVHANFNEFATWIDDTGYIQIMEG